MKEHRDTIFHIELGGKWEEYKEVADGKWDWVKITHDASYLSFHSSDYVELEIKSVTMLENYMCKDRAEFGRFFVACGSPSLVLKDLKLNLSTGPIFHYLWTLEIVKVIYRKLWYGTSLNDELFHVGVSLIANHLHEHSKPHPDPALDVSPWGLDLNFDHMQQLIYPPDTAEHNDEMVVYSHALSFAMMVEGALGATRLMEADNEAHWKKVTSIIHVSFAVAKAAIGSALLVGGFAVLLEPFEEAVLQHEAEKLTKKQVVEATINRLVTRTYAKAMEGVFGTHNESY